MTAMQRRLYLFGAALLLTSSSIASASSAKAAPKQCSPWGQQFCRDVSDCSSTGCTRCEPYWAGDFEYGFKWCVGEF